MKLWKDIWVLCTSLFEYFDADGKLVGLPKAGADALLDRQSATMLIHSM